MKSRFIVLALMTTQCFALRSQIENKSLFPTPNAASLGMYGQIDVNYLAFSEKAAPPYGLSLKPYFFVLLPVFQFKVENQDD